MNQNQIDRLYKKAISVAEAKEYLARAGDTISDAASTVRNGIVSGAETAGGVIGGAYNAAKGGIQSLPNFDFERFKQLVRNPNAQRAAIAGAGIAGVGAYKMMKKKKEDE